MTFIDYILAFLIGGTICLIAQIIMDVFKLLPIHLTIMFVCLGSCLEVFNLYDKLVELGGAGALLPISSFGHSLTDAALKSAEELGYLGLYQGMFNSTSAGIVVAIVSAFIISLLFKPKG
jgi:stage V sporulation protein AE